LRRPVYGLRQAPREWHDTLRTTLATLGFALSTADPSLFLHTDTLLPSFYVLVYVDDLVFATANTEALTLVKSELQKRHTCTDLGPSALDFQFSLPQPTPLSTGHSLSAPPLDESVEPSGPYPELVGCRITSGMGLVLGGRGPVVLTGHADASWVDDSATQRSSQGYTFSLGSGSVSWRSTRSSSVLSSSCEAEIYAGAMATQELRWLTYLLTDLGEQPHSPPILYQRGQLRLAYVATRANTADIFTKALSPGDHQPCFALLEWSCDHLFSPTLPMGLLLDIALEAIEQLHIVPDVKHVVHIGVEQDEAAAGLEAVHPLVVGKLLEAELDEHSVEVLLPHVSSSPPQQPAAVDSGAAAGDDTGGEGSGGAETEAMGDPAGGPGAGQPQHPGLLETLSPQQIRTWIVWRGSPSGGGYSPAGARAASLGGTAGARGAGGTAGGAGGAAGAGGTIGGAGGAAGAGGTRGAAGAGGAGAASPGGTGGAAGAGGARAASPRGTAGAGGARAAGTRGAGAAGAGGAGGAAGGGGAGAGGTGGAGAAGPGGARTGGAGAARAGGAAGAGGAGSAAGGTGAAGSGDAGAIAGGVAGAGGATRAAGTGGAGAAGAGGARGAAGTGGARAGGTGGTGAANSTGTAPRRPLFYPQQQSSLPPPESALRQVLSLPSSTGLTPPLLCSPTDQSPPQLLPGSSLSAPAPHTEVTESLTERRELETRASTPARARRVAHPRPPAVPSTHGMALRPSSVPQRVVLPEPPASSLPHVTDPESNLACAASPTVTCLLATVITDPDFESTTAFALLTEQVDIAARSRLDYVAGLVTESKSVLLEYGTNE
ncbi:unnamed protein product, partial [Closterium sp. NIES-53]